MNQFTKYFGLIALIISSFLGFLLLIVVFFYIAQLLSVSFLHIPGFDNFYEYTIVIIPYMIFFAAWYYLHKKILASKNMTAKIVTWIFLMVGSLTCLASLVLTSLKFFHVKRDWLYTFGENAPYALIIQIIFVFITAMAIAAGDPKEKSWLEKGRENMPAN